MQEPPKFSTSRRISNCDNVYCSEKLTVATGTELWLRYCTEKGFCVCVCVCVCVRACARVYVRARARVKFNHCFLSFQKHLKSYAIFENFTIFIHILHDFSQNP
jgi:hypothetical protein